MSSPSSLTFTPSVLRSIVAKICHDVGWHSAHVSTLNVLSDLLHHYLRKLSSVTVESAILAGRSQPTMEDMALAFSLMNIDLSQLQDYVLNVEPSPLEFSVPRYPVANRSNRVLNQVDPNEERPEHYDEWLPSLKRKESGDIYASNDFKPRITNDTMNFVSTENQKPTTDLKENGVDHSKEEKPDENADEDDQNTKLVVKFNLGKSTEENLAEDVPETGSGLGHGHQAAIASGTVKATLFQATSSKDIVHHLMASKAYMKFMQSSLPALVAESSEESRIRLRFPDSQRLPNCYLSRENSPEPPELENPESNPLSTVNVNVMDDGRSNKKTSKKKNKLNESENGPIVPELFNIKVKELGKKPVKGDKPPRPKKTKESKLVSKINVSGLSENIKPQDDGSTPKKRTAPRKPKPKKTDSETRLTIPKPDFVPSPMSEASFSFKISKNDSSFNEMGKLNDDGMKPGDDVGSDGNASFSFDGTGDAIKKKQGRPSTKRSVKAGTSKKVVSAEVVESSGDSSSDSNDDVDRNPVSLLVLPPDSGDSSLPPATGTETGKNLSKRRDSNSSVSSLASAAAVDGQAEVRIKPEKSGIDEQQHKSKEKDPSKHKKSKKHSKDKHRDADGKPHKKHKKSKDRDRIKDPMMKIKPSGDEEAKVFKHKKLNIKFGNSATPTEAMSPLPRKPVIPEGNSLLVEFSLDKSTGQLASSSINKKKKTVKPKKSETENELIFIKDKDLGKPKEAKIKKTQVINMGASLLAGDPSSSTAASFETGGGDVARPKTKAEMLFDRDVKKIKVEKLDTEFKPEQDSFPPPKKEKSSTSLASSKDAILAMAKKEKEMKKSDTNPRNCTLITETVKEIISADDKVWLCPNCSKPDDGTPMIGCDGCDEWYHYYCVGIQGVPTQEKWFCASCHERQKKEKKKEKRKSKKQPQEEQHSVTITPLPPLPSLANTDKLPPVSIFPVPGPSIQSDEMISPTSSHTCITPGYKPTGRPRGRPRKDSSNTPKLPSVTITAIGGGGGGPPPPSSSSNFHQRSSEPYLLDQQRQQQQVCHSAQQRNVGIGGGAGTSGVSLLKPMVNPLMMEQQQQSLLNKNIKEICPKCQIAQDLPINMIECDSCDQWYHWPCVGITQAPSPDTKWYCPRCVQRKARKQQQQLASAGNKRPMEPETMVTLLDRNPATTIKPMMMGPPAPPPAKMKRIPETPSPTMMATEDDEPAATNMCGTCKQTHTLEADIRWIQCDACDVWYHFICQNILVEPKEEETWFCRNCIAAQQNIINRIHSGSSKKRR